FNHPELGGSGQWMASGMMMIGDMFNNGLKARVDGLCRDVSAVLASQARAAAARELAAAIETHPAAAESLRLLLAKDWMAMGQQMSQAPGGSVLLVDPQSPASLLTALRDLQGGGKG
ncbi:MAG: hypothetical protein ACKOCM_01815, partial [Cyanobacteriota bacterium]